jgi:8-oxo-dGTP diphosphatase
VKVALLHGDDLLMLLRDNKPGLRFANMWDFPGGGREGEETPEECAIREIQEEFNIVLHADSFVFKKEYPTMHDPLLRAWFLVGHISAADISTIIFGNEGQGWKLFPQSDFFAQVDVVPQLKGRFQDYLDSLKNVV